MVRFSLGVVTPLLGERLEGFRSAFCAPVPFSWRYKTVARYKRKYGNKAEAGAGLMVPVCTLGSGPLWFSFWGTFSLLSDSARDM